VPAARAEVLSEAGMGRRPPGPARGRAVASAAVDPDPTPEPDLAAIAADLAGVETALAQLADGSYTVDGDVTFDEPPDPGAPAPEPEPA
jgi:hypothetical protein